MSNTKALLPGILKGVRVLDIAHQYSGANAAAILADLGAEVVAIEHPEGSPVRTMLPKKNGESLWWKVAQRGKRNVTLNLSSPRGRDIFLGMVKDYDVLIENFRPGTLERWGLGPDDLEKAGANLAMLRISGFGQTGPSSKLPGFGTVAEAMSGFAHMNGFPDGPPVFPSTTLADGVSSIWGTLGILAALVDKFRNNPQGVEVVDVALVEGLFRIIPVQIPSYDMLGQIQTRPGNFPVDHGVLRNTYHTRDGKYLVVAAVGPKPLRRILVAAQAPALIAQVDANIMDSHHAHEIEDFLRACDRHVAAWAAVRDYDSLVADLKAADAIVAPVYSAADIVKDPQYQARDNLPRVPDATLGPIMMQGIVPKFPRRDHKITHAGQAKGSDNTTVFGALGITPDEIAALRKEGVM